MIFVGGGSQISGKTNLTDGRIFVIGSIFGGTGASGVPVIIRKVHEEYKTQITAGNMHIGAAFLLPYFEFISPEDKKRLHAVSSDFAFNSQCALRYYEESQISNLLSEMYFVGNSTSTFVSTAPAGVEQKNPAMLPEVVAACGISKFFERGRHYDTKPSPYCSCREDEQNVNFNTLSEIPMLSSVDLVSFSQAAISLYTFLGEIKEMLRDKNKRDKTISWFPKYFPEADEFDDRDWEELKNKVTSMRGTCDIEVITDLANNTKNRKIEIKEYGYLATYLLWLFDAFSQVKDIHTEKLFTWIEDQGDNQAFSDLSRTAKDNSIRTLRQNLRDSSRCRDKKGFNDLSKRIYKHTTTASIRRNDKKSKKIAGGVVI